MTRQNKDLRMLPLAAALPIEPFISVGGSVIVAMIGGFFSVYVVRERKKTQAAQERDQKIDTLLSQTSATLGQVKNSHSSNLREDLDEKFDEVHRRLDRMDGRIDRLYER